MAGRRSRGSVIDRAVRTARRGGVAPPRTQPPGRQPPGAGHVFVVADGIDPQMDARRISGQLDGAPARIRVVVVPPRRPFDWTAVAWVDATTIDGYAWLGPPSPPRADAFDGQLFETQLLLGELLAHLRIRGIRAEGWVSDRRCVWATVPEAVRELPSCRVVTVLDGGRRPALPAFVARLIVRVALARPGIIGRHPRAVVRIDRTTSAPDPGHRVR